MSQGARSNPSSGQGRGQRGQGAGQGFGKGGAKGAKGGSKSGAGRSSAGRPKGPVAFGKERFGRNLGPATTPNTPNAKRPVRKTEPNWDSRTDSADGVRLQKVLANAGVASRRQCEEIIAAGRVEVNGEIVVELGTKVNPETDAIHVDGMRIQLNERLSYYAFNKPKGVVSSMGDPEGRPSILDYLKPQQAERLFHVGRLDQNTEGLLLLTNDGELANRLTHPSYEVPKTYLVQCKGPMGPGIGKQLREGIELEDGFAQVDSFKLVDSSPGKVLCEVVLHSGKNRIVRRMFDAVGHPVVRLVRLQVGPIGLGNTKVGNVRLLGPQEVGHLLASVGL
ncbi:pseudouridine synthase [Neomicrococcus aestuarii]|uniref:Pseudouridine synthase n=1 Tax=Neomicrococcus aestuarii TaxID=556325 RepID=A0A1L2ZMJ8_9MICC|nr:pseudouridine synthase [Neomicrococcus aestuarii]APF40248.1 pseudouridine synthase [Neomicrococcus aestuarii]MBB5511715.1 pseudouridine synthase [Neomicrococcus aestuarii]